MSPLTAAAAVVGWLVIVQLARAISKRRASSDPARRSIFLRATDHLDRVSRWTYTLSAGAGLIVVVALERLGAFGAVVDDPAVPLLVVLAFLMLQVAFVAALVKLRATG